MTNLSILTQKEITMTSREIAELTGKNHSHVMRDIRTLISAIEQNPELDYQLNQSLTVEYCPQTKRASLYYLDKDTTLTLLLGYDAVARMKVVKRWQELENQSAPKIPQTYAEALLEAGRLALENEEHKKQLALAAPKVEFVDKYVQSEGALGFRQVCKLLGVKEPEFRSFLYDTGIMYILGGQPTPKAQHIDAGRLIVKTGTSEGGYAFTTPKFTTKGVEWVAGEWAKYCLKRGF